MSANEENSSTGNWLAASSLSSSKSAAGAVSGLGKSVVEAISKSAVAAEKTTEQASVQTMMQELKDREQKLKLEKENARKAAILLSEGKCFWPAQIETQISTVSAAAKDLYQKVSRKQNILVGAALLAEASFESRHRRQLLSARLLTVLRQLNSSTYRRILLSPATIT